MTTYLKNLLLPVLIIFTVNAFASEKSPGQVRSEKPVVEVVFALDTTGSMGGLIDAAKEKIWSIANTLSKGEPAPDIRMGLIGFRDKGDSYVTIRTDLTDNLDAVYAELMDFTAEGGGDTPEDVNRALNESILKISWSPGNHVYRVVFLVGDAPPQMGYRHEPKYPDICRTARSKDIHINTIQCGNMQETVRFFQEIAEMGNGSYFRVAQDGNAVMYNTPFDSELANLSLELDRTRVYYGDQTVQKEMHDREVVSGDVIRKSKPSAMAKRAVYNAGVAGSKNFGGDKEIISLLQQESLSMKDVDSEMLPPLLQKMSRSEQELYLNENLETRKVIQKKINAVSVKRQGWIKNKLSNDTGLETDTFDYKVYQCIKHQAAVKKIVYLRGPEF